MATWFWRQQRQRKVSQKAKEKQVPQKGDPARTQVPAQAQKK